MSLLAFDRKLLKDSPEGVVGIDEAGRGALVGSVFAAAVLVKPEFYKSRTIARQVKKIDDSKKLTPKLREEVYEQIKGWANEGLLLFAFAQGTVDAINRYNIFGATQLAMRASLEEINKRVPNEMLQASLSSLPLFENCDVHNPPKVYIDGIVLKKFPYKHEAIAQGDSKSLAIAMASIVAKVERDRYMELLHDQYPQYAFASHKGYGTQVHREALIANGPCPEHRPLFISKIMAGACDSI